MMTEEQHLANALTAFIGRPLDNPLTRSEMMETARIALAALTQPASPDLRLPDAFSPHDAKMFCAAHGVTGAYELASQMANYAVDKVKRLNAPHTAPIEPICATGGAEWVKEAERLAEIHGISFVVFRHGEQPQCTDPTKVVISFTDNGLGYEKAAPEDK